MKIIIYLLIFCLCIQSIYAQHFTNRWQNVYGGAGADVLSSVQLTKDNGFILSGYSNSNTSGTKQQDANSNSNDYWVVKIDAQGSVQWSKTIGGNGDDLNTSVLQTKDGGYLVGGISVSDVSGNKTIAERDSSYDFWIVKLDAAGNILWDNTIGGSFAETMQSLAEGPDFYIAAGSSYSDIGYEKKENNMGAEDWADYWIVKMTTAGKIVWSNTYGGANQDQLAGFQICADGGNLMGGYTYSPRNGLKTTATIGNSDYYVVKTDAAGKPLWDASYGGQLSEFMTDLKQTSDAGFIIGGYSNSPAYGQKKTGPFLGGTDYWMVKTDKNGNKQWDQSYGGNKNDYLVSVQQTADKGFLLGGYSNSSIGGTKSEPSFGGYDYWVVKTDSTGNVQWDKTIGGTGDDKLATVLEVAPGEYLAGGTSNSITSGNKTPANIGNTGQSDYWLVRFGVTDVSNATQASQNSLSSSTFQTLTDNASLYTRLHVTLSPNPVFNTCVLSYTNAETTNNILTILSADGKAIYHTIVQNASNTITLNLSGYAAGIYYASLSAGNKTVVQKFIKK